MIEIGRHGPVIVIGRWIRHCVLPKTDALTLCLRRSYLPTLQRLCVLRRSVARRLYMPYLAYAQRSDWPVADDVDNCRRHITRPLKN